MADRRARRFVISDMAGFLRPRANRKRMHGRRCQPLVIETQRRISRWRGRAQNAGEVGLEFPDEERDAFCRRRGWAIGIDFGAQALRASL